MIKKVEHIEHRLNELKADSTVSPDSIRLLIGFLEQWREDLVEVPGNGHHDHGHALNHSATPELIDEQMLEIQKELDERLSGIGKRATQLKPQLTHDEHIH